MSKKMIWIFILVLLFIALFRINYLYNLKHNDYYNEFLLKTNKIVYGLQKPRGRIYDVNGNLLVDNKEVLNIVYRNINSNYIDDAYLIGDIVTLDYELSDNQVKDFYLLNKDFFYLITDEEKELYLNRKISNEDIIDYKRNRVVVSDYNDRDYNAIRIYYRLINGYSYDNKIIKDKDVTVNECFEIEELSYEGLSCELSYKREFKYDTLSSIIGFVGSIPKEDVDYYLDRDYLINDKVGISFLEKQYEDFLKGTRDVYKVNDDNSLTKILNGVSGNDLCLTIDINMQNDINEIVKKILIKSKSLKNTDLYNRSFVIVSDPNNGNILSMVGTSYYNDSFYDVTSDIILSSYTVGSVIKGASMTVGYRYNLIDIGKKINDECVKLKNLPEKCSYKRWGYIDDITALKTSSNYYQFLLAIKLAGYKYKRNMVLPVTSKEFDIYRNTFTEFGLGTSTGIDLPNESYGIKGNKIAPDLLLNLAIGQYDTYTPLQLSQYINTIAMNGSRYSMNLVSRIVSNDGEVLFGNKPLLLSKTESRFDRIKEGMRQVLNGGTGAGFVKTKYNPVGKTGTSEVYYDKDNNVINQTFVMYAPLDNPKYSVTIVSPKVSISNNKEEDDYTAPINYYLSKEITDLVFSRY